MIYLLVGIGRSGTSLLQSILFHQDGIVVYPETQLFRRFLIANNTAENAVTKQQLVDILRLNNPRVTNLQNYINLRKLDKEMYSIDEIVDLFKKENRSILLKDARDLDYLPEISARVADLRVICTIRDLRDVILSRMKAGFSKKWGTLLNLIIMRFQYTSLLRFEKQEKVYLIRYEDFINENFDGINELGIINNGLKNIDLNAISTMLFSDEELSKHKGKNKKKVDSRNYKKWKKALPKRHIFWVELFFRDYFRRFGYTTVYNSKSISIANSIINHLCSAIYFLYHWVSVYRDKRFYKL